MNVYEIITEQIVKRLKAGVIPWHRDWVSTSGAWNRMSGKNYSWLNTMLLGENGEYASFKQWKVAGGTIKKGAESRICVFFQPKGFKPVKTEDEIVLEPTQFCLRYYHVFHINDVDGVEQKHHREADLPGVNNQTKEAPEKIVREYLEREKIPTVICDQPAYHPDLDYISMPELKQFNSVNAYYATMFHEMAHSTGSSNRLNREIKGRFGTKDYAREELVAEMASAFLMSIAGLGMETLDNSAAYINSWKQKLRNDPYLIVNASAKAERAAKYITDPA